MFSCVVFSFLTHLGADDALRRIFEFQILSLLLFVFFFVFYINSDSRIIIKGLIGYLRHEYLIDKITTQEGMKDIESDKMNPFNCFY
jgi:hypothetical protein